LESLLASQHRNEADAVLQLAQIPLQQLLEFERLHHQNGVGLDA
jgi:hypothetical protein